MFRKDVFAHLPAPQKFVSGGHEFEVPIRYRRLDCFFAVCVADLAAAKRLLPSARFNPVQVWPGRCLIALNAFNYLDTDIGPYGEFSVGIPCTLANAPQWPGLGVFIHRLPVTTDLAMAAGIEVWGYPKFVCDMNFQSTPLEHAVTLSSGGNLILELHVSKGGFSFGAGADLNTFTVKDNQIISTRIQSSSVLRLSPNGLASLKLGDHAMSLELKSLNLSPRPLLTGDLLDASMLLPIGESVGPVSFG